MQKNCFETFSAPSNISSQNTETSFGKRMQNNENIDDDAQAQNDKNLDQFFDFVDKWRTNRIAGNRKIENIFRNSSCKYKTKNRIKLLKFKQFNSLHLLKMMVLSSALNFVCFKVFVIIIFTISNQLAFSFGSQCF